ncbi:hypothetical protein [Polyangium sp. 6x1]|uniref:hypothetical protein n=1 Tax=Polyangium sp. 6x1 TaxID=3042689 RepID=UPI002482B970|nr:hypothetical protein [Polyangium sp. 6x1]MDI1451767.1 hypothetical protein [Polyangium sp. 6x1]
MTNPSTRTFQYFETPNLVTAQGHFEGQNQILDWSLKEKPDGLATQWSDGYESLDKTKPGDWWDNPNNPQAKQEPGGGNTQAQSSAESKDAASSDSTSADASFTENKTIGYLYTSEEGPGGDAATGAPAAAPVEKPNEALQAMLDKEKVPWYQRAWEATKGAVRSVIAAELNPIDGFIGVVKGLVNMVSSDLWNLAVMLSKQQTGMSMLTDLQESQALRLAHEGRIAEANEIASRVAQFRQWGMVGDLWAPSNEAQRGGALLSVFVPVGGLVKVVTGTARGIKGVAVAEDLSQLAKAEAEAARLARAEEVARAEKGVTKADEARNAADDIAASSDGVYATKKADVWKEGPVNRGRLIEEDLAKTEYDDWIHTDELPGYSSAKNYPVVDFAKDNQIVSLKTADTQLNSWYSKLRGDIRTLADFTPPSNLASGNVSKILDLRVQPGGIELAGQKLKDLANYAREYGIELRVKPYP